MGTLDRKCWEDNLISSSGVERVGEGHFDSWKTCSFIGQCCTKDNISSCNSCLKYKENLSVLTM